MSGHSKWHNIKLRKGKADALRGARFTKISKEIILAAKGGSPDPDANYRLKMAVEKARENNMPVDNVKRAIARGSGTSGEREIEEIRYEGYGPASVAVIVDIATDNRNRTAAEMRFLFSRHEGSLGETGSVGWMFEPRGFIEIESGERSEDQITESALIDGVIDVRYAERSEILTEPAALASVREGMLKAGFTVTAAELGADPKTPLVVAEADVSAVVAFLDALDEHEDVVRVWTNAQVDPAHLEALV